MINNRFKKMAFVLITLLELTSGVHAATINADGIMCTLNDAVTAANTDAIVGGCSKGTGADIIELPIDGTLTLFDSVLNVDSEITINGNNSKIQPILQNVHHVIFYVNNGDLTLNDVTISNGRDSHNRGGGLIALNSIVSINNSKFINNKGGAIYLWDSETSITDSVVDNNSDLYISPFPRGGGGIEISGGVVEIINSTISNNSSIHPHSGGGGLTINDYSDIPLRLIIINTTISGNSNIKHGGGIRHRDFLNESEIILDNVTLVNNSADGDGGGISSDGGTITINQSLISGNSGGGGAEINSTGGIINVDNNNIFGLNGNSGLIGVAPGATDTVPKVPNLSDIIDTNLADNGGSTPTHALTALSPALDAVLLANCNLQVDQTGKVRPIDGDGNGSANCDIGAFENNKPDIIFKDGFEIEVLLHSGQ